jgi:hypothetical protein
LRKLEKNECEKCGNLREFCEILALIWKSDYPPFDSVRISLLYVPLIHSLIMIRQKLVISKWSSLKHFGLFALSLMQPIFQSKLGSSKFQIPFVMCWKKPHVKIPCNLKFGPFCPWLFNWYTWKMTFLCEGFWQNVMMDYESTHQMWFAQIRTIQFGHSMWKLCHFEFGHFLKMIWS